MKELILITGAPRSGTSLTAGILYYCGAFGGYMCGETLYNKKGQFENTDIRRFVLKKVLSDLGADPLGQYSFPNLEEIRKYPMSPKELRNRVFKILTAQGLTSDVSVVFIKAIKICLVWPLWVAAFPTAKWIIVRRDRESIARSCLRTGFMRVHKNVASWKKWVEQFYESRFKELKDCVDDLREVWPSDIIEKKDYSKMKSIVQWCGLEWDETKVNYFVTDNLWHHRKEDGKSNRHGSKRDN